MTDSRNIWLAILGTALAAQNLENRLWWCVKPEAKIGDRVLVYCPRSASERLAGIFAECAIKTLPVANDSRCRGYGTSQNGPGKLCFVELELLLRFAVPLKASDMKRDKILANSNFVKRNFQGTTFLVDNAFYQRISKMIQKLNLPLKKAPEITKANRPV